MFIVGMGGLSLDQTDEQWQRALAQTLNPAAMPHRVRSPSGWKSGYAAVLEHDQLSAGYAVQNFNESFRVSDFKITSRVMCGFPLVPETPDYAVDDNLEAFVLGQWFSRSEMGAPSLRPRKRVVRGMVQRR